MSNNKENSKNISSFVGNFLAELDARHRDVIKLRYGLGGGRLMTLQAIGNKYKITRERVRQIEAAGLSFLRKKLDSPYIKSFIQAAREQLTAACKVQKENHFLEGLKKLLADRTPTADFANHARLLLDLSQKFLSHRDNYGSEWHYHWYLSRQDRKKAYDFVAKLEATLNKKREEIISGKKFDEVLRDMARRVKVPPAAAQNYLAISKKFSANPFGEFGLKSWPEIHPKTAKDWAYVILKKEQKPLHFSELSDKISKHRKDKTTNLQTVHNELIKDDRFVLVGRGVYGLKEFGLIPGTAREIIAQILKKHGTLPSREVIKLVNHQRFFKEGTILINLQNKKHFERLPDGRYCLRKS